MVAAAPLRVVFFGTPDFAVPTLEALLHSQHHVVAVVTQPDRPRGRGQKTVDGPVKALAVKAGVPVLQPLRLRDSAFVDGFMQLGPDLGVVAAYGKILPEDLIEAPRLGMINVHASLLPKYRGAAPVHRAVIAGESQTGVTIMRVVKALDAGPMMAMATRSIDADETSEVVERDLARIGAPLLVSVVDRLAAGTAEEIPQNDALATYAPRLTKDDGVVDWSWPALRIHNLIRGLHPWPHAFSFLSGSRVILRRSFPIVERVAAHPGTVTEAHGDRLVVASGDAALRLLEIQPEGKRPLTAREFLAGHRVAAGARFSAQP